MKKISLEARLYLIENEPAHVKALALVNDSFFTRFFINVFSVFKRKIRAVKMFKTKSEAINWAKKFGPQNRPQPGITG
jgi:hypothetical protein